MRYLGIPFNAITATILAITIGLGIDYTVHTTHRFIDEYKRGADAYESLSSLPSAAPVALLREAC